jgi:tetratricopeptide (TPR) repeat protein
MLAAPPSILLAIAPVAQTAPAAPPPPAPAVKGKAAAKPAPPPTTGPQAAKAALDRATAQMSQGAYDQAQREYAAAAAADPGNSEARAGVIAARALGKLQAGQVQAAVDDLNASIALQALPEAYEALGRIYAANGTRGAAVDSFNEAIRLRPNYAQAYFGRAEARRERAAPLRDMTELQQAADDYKAVLVVKSDLPEALYGLGVTRFLLNDYAAAVESFDGVLRVRPMFADAKYARARARFELTQYQEALKDIVDLPATFDAYARGCSAGMAFFALGDAALVARDESRAIELFNLSSRAFDGGLAARPDDPRIKFWAQVSRQNANPGPPGTASRAKERLIMQFTPGKRRPAPAPTATLVHADACRRT